MKRYPRYWWVVLLTPLALIAQTQTNLTTNGVTLDPEIFPRGKEAIWLSLIPPITFTITWLFGKIPPLPKEVLPWITPLIGVAVGSGLDWASSANWPWWSSAGAGTIAVAMYEAAKGITHAGTKNALTPTEKKTE